MNSCRKHWGRGVWASLPALIIAVALAAGCGGDKSTNPVNNNNGGGGNGPTVSAEMAGTYTVVTTLRDCQTNQELQPPTEFADTLCVGANLRDALGEGSGCTLTQAGNGYRLVCDTTEPLEAGCDLKSHFDLTLTYTNTSYQAVGQVTFSTNPAGCQQLGVSCANLSVVGTRTGPVPAGACQ